jgi:uncharacterized protein DUF2771
MKDSFLAPNALKASFMALSAALLLAGCSASAPPKPEVRFSVEGQTVSARPFLYCDVMVTSCDRDNGAQAKLTIAPGKQLTVAVPNEVAESPWSVVIEYRTAAGEQKQPETVATFVPNERHDYTVTPPAAGDQLQTVEIKQAGAKQDPAAAAGDIQLLARAVWSLQIQSS